MEIVINRNTPNFEVKKNDVNIDLNAQIIMNQLKFEWVDPPETRNSPGIPGQASFSDDFFYICVAQDVWARTILTKGF